MFLMSLTFLHWSTDLETLYVGLVFFIYLEFSMLTSLANLIMISCKVKLFLKNTHTTINSINIDDI